MNKGMKKGLSLDDFKLDSLTLKLQHYQNSKKPQIIGDDGLDK